MIVNAIYRGAKPVQRIYHCGEIIFRGEPVEFHVMEDGKLIILGALRANDLPDGLYLDCAPNVEWIYPVQSGNVLTIEQVYGAVQNGNILEVG
jgi:hypothetical protein